MLVVTLDRQGNILSQESAKDYQAAGKAALAIQMDENVQCVQIWKDGENGQDRVIVQSQLPNRGIFAHCNPKNFEPKLPDRLRVILNDLNLTIYGAAQIIGSETDEPIKTIHCRLTRYLDRPPESWHLIERDLAALGYKITIQKCRQR